VPYSDYRELIMDILKHGSDVKVIEPENLKKIVLAEVDNLIKNYS